MSSFSDTFRYEYYRNKSELVGEHGTVNMALLI